MTATCSRPSCRRRPICTRATAESCRRSRPDAISISSHRSCARRSTSAGTSLDSVEQVAVTQGPGLVGALLVGVSAAKAIAWARRSAARPGGSPRRAYRVALPRAGASRAAVPLSARQRRAHAAAGRPRAWQLGAARNDARRRRGRGVRQGGAASRPRAIPGGAEIDRIAQDGDPSAFPFPVARVPGLDFSFSGLKTALLYTVRELGDRRRPNAEGPTWRPRIRPRSSAH